MTASQQLKPNKLLNRKKKCDGCIENYAVNERTLMGFNYVFCEDCLLLANRFGATKEFLIWNKILNDGNGGDIDIMASFLNDYEMFAHNLHKACGNDQVIPIILGSDYKKKEGICLNQ